MAILKINNKKEAVSKVLYRHFVIPTIRRNLNEFNHLRFFTSLSLRSE